MHSNSNGRRHAPGNTKFQEAGPSAPLADASYYYFNENLASDEAPGLRSWYARAQSFVTVYHLTEVGAVIDCSEQPDEYAIIVPDSETMLSISSGSAEVSVRGFSITFVPGGPSSIKVVAGGGRVICLHTYLCQNIIARCEALNAAFQPDPNVPELVPWPDPIGGQKVRTYSMDVAPEEGRFGRLFRSTNFMINYVYARNGTRDRPNMVPHSHDNHQQISLCLEGSYVHHLRWPWDAKSGLWRDDNHRHCPAPSAAVIPAGVLHTSEPASEGINQLIDIFCPPRFDFLDNPGWVLNADDYPAPDGY